MSMPFYVSPEQVMNDKAQYARKGIARGRSLCGLVFDGPAVPAPGTALLYEGREAGNVGTAVHSLALDRPVGLAILHRRAAAPGSRLELAGGGPAEVRALPLVDQSRAETGGAASGGEGSGREER